MSVTVTDAGTNTAVVAVTDVAGTYRLTRLAPGTYQIVFEKAGFRPQVRDTIAIAVNDQLALDAILELGAVEDVVVVEAQVPLLQARSAEVSGLIDQKRVRELPLNGGNFQRLALLAPGASGSTGGSPNNPAFSGSRMVANSVTLDGTGINDERGPLGGVSLGGGAADFGTAAPRLISTESIREFRVITSNADATFGRGSGAQVNVVTRSGTNQYSATSYYFGRNAAPDARDFFNSGPFVDDRGHAVTPPFSQHLYGGTIGGPVARDSETQAADDDDALAPSKSVETTKSSAAAGGGPIFTSTIALLWHFGSTRCLPCHFTLLEVRGDTGCGRVDCLVACTGRTVRLSESTRG